MPLKSAHFRTVTALTLLADATPVDQYDTILGVQVTNTTTAKETITVSAFIRRGGNDHYVATDIPVPYGSATPLIADKVGLEPGDQFGITTSGQAGGIGGSMMFNRGANA